MPGSGNRRFLSGAGAFDAADVCGMEPQIGMDGRGSTAAAAAAGYRHARGAPRRRMHSQDVGQAEVGAWIAPLVIQRALAGSDQRSATLHELTHGSALRIG